MNLELWNDVLLTKLNFIHIHASDHHQSSSAMPKKFKGENSKAVVAKARKAEAMKAETERIERQKEDESWHDDSKQVARKQQRKVQ